MRSRRRIARLIAKRTAERDARCIGFRQTDGTVKYIRTDGIEDVWADVMKGRDTLATRALLCADSATDGSKVHQLLQSIHRPAYVPQTRSEVIQ